MRKTRIAVLLDVKRARRDRVRFARECAKLDPREEQALAEEVWAVAEALHEWPRR